MAKARFIVALASSLTAACGGGPRQQIVPDSGGDESSSTGSPVVADGGDDDDGGGLDASTSGAPGGSEASTGGLDGSGSSTGSDGDSSSTGDGLVCSPQPNPRLASALVRAEGDDLVLELASAPRTCGDPPAAPGGCDTWLATIRIPAAAQAPGVYDVFDDLEMTKFYSPADQGTGCPSVYDVATWGTLEILALDGASLVGSLCDTYTLDADVNGAFEATVCP